MSHIFDDEQVFEQKLYITVPRQGNKRPERVPFHVTYEPASRELLRELSQVDDAELQEQDLIGQELKKHIRAWDLANKDGTPMEVNDENLKRVFNRVVYFEAIYKGWLDVSKNAPLKN